MGTGMSICPHKATAITRSELRINLLHTVYTATDLPFQELMANPVLEQLEREAIHCAQLT